MGSKGPKVSCVMASSSQDMPVIPIYHASINMMLSDQIKGWPVNNVEQNWYAKDLYKVAE